MGQYVFGYFVLLQILLVSLVLGDSSESEIVYLSSSGDEDLAVGIIIAIIIIPIIIVVALVCLLCFCCACCCFSGRRSTNHNQVFAPQVVSTIQQPQYQQQYPPTIIYQQGQGPYLAHSNSVAYQYQPGQQHYQPGHQYPPGQEYEPSKQYPSTEHNNLNQQQ